MPSHRRILLCRLGFVLLAIVPTLGTCGWLIARALEQSAFASPAASLTAAALAADLSRQLGVVVEIDTTQPVDSVNASSDVPSIAYDLVGLRLLDPETSRPLATADAATLTLNGNASHLAVSLVQTDVDALPKLVRVLHDRVLCGPAASLRTAKLDIRQLIIAGGDAPQTLVGLSLNLTSTPASPQAELAFQPASAPPDSPQVRLSLARNRDVVPPATLITLDTAGHALPLSLIAALVPELESIALGNAASGVSFRGSAQFVPARDGASGTLAGTFHGLDLDRLVSERFPHHLSGQAELVVDRAVFSGGRLESLGGRLLAERGGISPSLVAAASEHLDLGTPLDTAALASDRLLPFTHLAIGFRLDGQAIELTGLAGLRSQGALLVGQHGPLLAAPPAHRTAAVGLVRTLVPASEIQVPATRETSTLIGLFPAPDIVLPRTAVHSDARPATHLEDAPRAPAPLRHTPTRLRASGPAESAPVLRQPEWR
jgi:hypothetical protein